MLVSGAINWDTTLFVEELPQAGEEMSVSRIISVPGGKGANTAVAAARILGAGEAGAIGMLGSDDVGDNQIKILESEGVDTSCIVRQEGVASGQAFVLVDSRGENMILTHMAANRAITPAILAREKIASAVEQARMLVVIDPPLAVAVALIEKGSGSRANKNSDSKTEIVWSPALLARHGFGALRDHMARADCIILNEHEAMLLAPSAGSGVQACVSLSEALGGNKVVTTLGREGCVFCSAGRKALIPAIDLQSLGLKVASTVGAGDAFVGAYGAYRAKGLDDLQSLFMAGVAAALKTTREETRGSPRHDEIMRCMEDSRVHSLFEGVRLV